MKLAVIGSYKHLSYLGAHTSYHLALAQEVWKDGFLLDYYQKCAALGDFIILDNGIAEGTVLDFDLLMRLADSIPADEVVLQDVQRNKTETLDASFNTSAVVEPRRRMVVPQGKDWKDWLECLEAFETLEFRSIGIPKLYEAYPGGRARALSVIHAKGLHRTHDVHLLGCHSNPLKEIHEAYYNFPWIRGVDTAAVFAYAQSNISLNSGTHVSYDPGKDIDQLLTENNFRDLSLACQGRYAPQNN